MATEAGFHRRHVRVLPFGAAMVSGREAQRSRSFEIPMAEAASGRRRDLIALAAYGSIIWAYARRTDGRWWSALRETSVVFARSGSERHSLASD